MYCWYSANSWLKPNFGDRCSPATKPSTTVFATRSRDEMEASTAGSRNCCSIVRWTCGYQPRFFLISRGGLQIQHLAQKIVLRQPIRFRMEIQQNPMPEDR